MDPNNSPTVLGKGSYGCVLIPPLPCKTGATIHKIASESPKQVVGKIMSRKDTYNIEVAIAKVIAKIDPESKYFLYPTSACEIEPREIPKCALDDEARYQLIMPYGGIDLKEWLEAHKGSVRRYQLVEMLLPIFEAVVVLSEADYCHQDIKVYNILVPDSEDGDGDDGGSARLIDNSLTRRLSTIYEYGNMRRRLHEYFPYPPEYRLLNYIMDPKKDKKNTEAAVAETLRNILSKSNGRYFFKYHDREAYKNAIVGAMGSIQKNIFAINPDRVDVYSIGAVLIYSHKYLEKADDPGYNLLVANLTEADPKVRLSPKAALKAAKAYLSATAAATAEAAAAKVRRLLS